jgi:hypothetical protein
VTLAGVVEVFELLRYMDLSFTVGLRRRATINMKMEMIIWSIEVKRIEENNGSQNSGLNISWTPLPSSTALIKRRI